MKKNKKTKILLIIALFAINAAFVIAAGNNTPTGPETITVESSGRHTESTASVPVTAEAGNVSELKLTDVRITQHWQGYYGNITGNIVLDDADNYTLYDWSLPDPTGEIYASNGSSVWWGDIHCFNFTNHSDHDSDRYWNASTVEHDFHINVTEKDGLEETFNLTYTNTSGFFVGGININNMDECNMVTTYVDEAHQLTHYREVLLTDNASLIFTALLETSYDGFKSGAADPDPHDFQMLVLEDGTPGYETTTTTYYFFVELS